MKDTVFYSKKTLNLGGRLLDLTRPAVMGIINVTPDSFYDGGRLQDDASIVRKAAALLEAGAQVLDVGGYSSRPGATEISEEEELSRVVPAIRAIMKSFPGCYLSVDTFRSEMARRALEEGASIINDISGGAMDEKIADVAAAYNAPYILMHMNGTPQTMATLNTYEDILDEMLAYFLEKITVLKEKGIKDIIIDPGFGFSKNIAQNYFILKNLEVFKILGLPVLAGISRKSMIYKKLHTSADNALNGSTVLHTVALSKGANILRVHDVKEASEAILLFESAQ